MTKQTKRQATGAEAATRAPARKVRASRKELLDLRDLPASFVPQTTESKRGRPRKTPTVADISRVERCAALGMNKTEIAIVLGIDRGTFSEYEASHFSTALEKGRARGKMSASIALARAMARGNVGAIVWYERTRVGYTERVEQTFSGPNGEPIAIGIYLPANGREVELPVNGREVVLPPVGALPSRTT